MSGKEGRLAVLDAGQLSDRELSDAARQVAVHAQGVEDALMLAAALGLRMQDFVLAKGG